MMRARLGILLLIAGAPALQAQSPATLVNQGVRAYQDLSLDTAAQLLRRGLAPTATPPLTDAELRRALSYLGAVEFFAGRRDSAAAVFQRLVLAAPRFRLDSVVFQPELVNLFDAVRNSTSAVAAAVDERDVTLGEDPYPIRLYASRPHSIQVRMLRDDGTLIRELYDGLIGDSLVIRWVALDTSGTAPATGRLICEVLSRDAQGQPARRLRVPLTITSRPDDAPAAPAAPAAPRRRTLGGFATGLLAATAAVALPAVIAGPGDATAGRYLVAGAISVAGVAALLSRPRRTPPAPLNAQPAGSGDGPGEIRLHITPGRPRAGDAWTAP